MSATERQRLSFWQRTRARRAAKREAKMGAVALKPQLEPLAPIIVAQGPNYVVKLVHIPEGTSPAHRPESVADIICLDLHEFTVAGAIAWVQAAQNVEIGDEPSAVLCIAVLGSIERLSVEELWRLSHELVPAGAIFHEWPAEARSFADAYIALSEEISKTYGTVSTESSDQGELDLVTSAVGEAELSRA